MLRRRGLRAVQTLGAAVAVVMALGCSESTSDGEGSNTALTGGPGVTTAPGPTAPVQGSTPATSPQGTPVAAPEQPIPSMTSPNPPPTAIPPGTTTIGGGGAAGQIPQPTEGFGGAGGQGGDSPLSVGGGGGAGGAGGNGGSAGGGGSGGATGGTAGVGGAGATGGAGGGAEPGYQACPESGPCKIMPFGDSITESCCIFNGGYRVELFRLARDAGQEVTFVGSVSNGPAMVDGVPFPQDHEGHGGYTIEGGNGIAQFVMPSINAYQPDIITLMIGTNDINGNLDLQNAPNRLGNLLDSIFDVDPDILVVLAQIVPTGTDGTNQRVQSYNAAMPGLVEERVAMGRHIILVDMYNAFTQDANYKTSLLDDNLHPNEAGYVLMGEVWYDVIAPYLR